MFETLKNVALIILIAVVVWFIIDTHLRIKAIKDYFIEKSELEDRKDETANGNV